MLMAWPRNNFSYVAHLPQAPFTSQVSTNQAHLEKVFTKYEQINEQVLNK